MKYCKNCNANISSGSKTGLCIKCSRKAHPVWNTGKRETRTEVLDKMSKAKAGKIPYNKGKTMLNEQKIKLSCSVRGIDISDFDELQTAEAKIERNKFKELGLPLSCFEKSDFKCDSCGLNNTELNAHHLNSWKFFPESRFELDNLVALCKSCHYDFHTIYGNGKKEANTIQQYIEFKSSRKNHFIKKNVFIVAGVSGSGKSWVCSQLADIAQYIPFDDCDKKNIRSIIFNAQEEKIIYDPTVHVTSFIKRNSDVFNIRLLVINESLDVVKTRIQSRGGEFTDNMIKRHKRMAIIKNAAEFSGTSNEVLNYLKKVLTN
jgi:hypothetical protein